MPSAEPHNETENALRVIPGHLMNGPRVVTIRQPDGSCVRMSYCRRHKHWHAMWIYATDKHIMTAPVPPISVVRSKQGYA